jgi:hypothetical protein
LEAISKSKFGEKVVMADTRRKNLFGDLKTITPNGKDVLYQDGVDSYPYFIGFGDEKKYIYPDISILSSQHFHSQEAVLRNIQNYQIAYDKDLKNQGTDNQVSLVEYYEVKFTTVKGLIRHSITDKVKRDEALKELQSDFPIIIDFKYKSAKSPNDEIKQNFYLLCDKRFSIAEFWLPCGDGVDCNKTVPQGLDDFKDTQRKNVRIRKINIKNLVHFYIGGKNA